MKIYDIFDSGWLGVYRERAVVVFISGYRKVKTTVCDWKTVIREVTTPDNWVYVRYFIEGHEGLVTHTETEHEVTRLRTVPEHYEKRTETTPAHWGTREYWLEPHIEIQYRFVGTQEQRAGRYGWEEAEGEWEFVGTEEQRAGRAGWESYEVEIPGCWEERRILFPEVTRTYDVLIPEHEEEYTEVIPARTYSVMEWIPLREAYRWVNRGGKKEIGEEVVWVCEEIEVDQPIFSYYYPEYEYEVLSIRRGPVMVIVGEPEGDKIRLRTPVSKIVEEMEGRYLGNATRIGDNEYILPVPEPAVTVEPEPLTEEEIEKIKWGD